MNTILRHDEKNRASLLDFIGAPVSALTGIFLLFYPYVVGLSILDDPSQMTGPRVVKVSICILFAFLFFVPRATQTFLRSRRNWFGAFFIRFILLIVFAWICFKFMESAKYYPGALNSLKIGGFDKAYLVLFSTWAFFYLSYFVVPGKYIRHLRLRHEAKVGFETTKIERQSMAEKHGSAVEFLRSTERPVFVRIAGMVTLIMFAGLGVDQFFTVSYPSQLALDLYGRYWPYLSAYFFISLLALVLFIKGQPFGAYFRVARSGAIIYILGAALFSWFIPYALFHSALPAHYHYIDGGDRVFKTFIVDGNLPPENARKCKRGVYINDPTMDEPYRLKVCKVPDAIYRTLSPDSAIQVSATESIMGYNLNTYLPAN